MSDPEAKDEAAEGEAEQGAASAGEDSPRDESSPSASESTPAEPQDEADAPQAPASGRVLIEAEGLCKYYGAFTAIEDVSFEVRRGQVVGFLGPNGAGKSTTMKILTGVLSPDRGEARICGLSVVHNRIEVAHELGFLPENGPLYPDMTPRELLRFLGEARGLDGGQIEERIRELSERLSLKSVLGKAIRKLSKGYRQRVGFAQALIHEPKVLIMDEPASGLDPNQIRDVRAIIRDFAEDKAILLSTHILQEVEAVCDRVVFINKGRLVFQGSVEELRESGPDLDDAFATHTGYSAGTS